MREKFVELPEAWMLCGGSDGDASETQCARCQARMVDKEARSVKRTAIKTGEYDKVKNAYTCFFLFADIA